MSNLSERPERRNEKLRAIVRDGGGGRAIVVSGRQNVRTLRALVAKGEDGITALELSSWALRLAHYVSQLRHKYGIAIQTAHEPHDGGKHARYKLLTTVEISSREVTA